MDLRNPLQSLSWALTRALERDLNGVASPLATQLLGQADAPPVTKRPTLEDCSIALFTQIWTLAGLGFDLNGSQSELVEAETTVIWGPAGDACVYVGTQLLYHIGEPNVRFHSDVAAHRMASPSNARNYERGADADEDGFAEQMTDTFGLLCVQLKGLPRAVVERLQLCIQARLAADDDEPHVTH